VFYKNLSQIEIELTTRCNAACPQCARNFYGGKTWHSLPIVDLPLDTIIKLQPHLKDITHIKLCGTYGDPCIHPDFYNIIDWIHENSNCSITINTNGSMHRTEWWSKLATKLRSGDKVHFGIDGLEDTHHLHRRGTSFNKIIKNLKAFNNAGGISIWNYIVFKHNQHQVEQARELSKKIGCDLFAVKSTSRFVDKTHNLIEKLGVKDRTGQTVYWLEPANGANYVNQGYNVIKKINNYPEYLKTNPIHCQAKHTNYVTISAEGYVFPCGFLQDRMYGYEAESHSDRDKLLSMIDQSGGFDLINIDKTDLHEIVNGILFQSITNSWNNSDRLQRCAHQCGIEHRLFQHANKDLEKIWVGKTLFDIPTQSQ